MVQKLGKTAKNLSRDSQCPSQDFKPTPPEYRSEVSAFLSTCSVKFLMMVTTILKHALLCNIMLRVFDEGLDSLCKNVPSTLSIIRNSGKVYKVSTARTSTV